MAGPGVIRRLPILSTAVVLAAAAVMVALGVWQLQRKAEKEAVLARFAQAQAATAEVAWPSTAAQYPSTLYRRATIDCTAVEDITPIAGRSATGRSGWAQIARCRLDDGGEAAVAIGWSPSPALPRWNGGYVSGFVGPAGEGVRLVATEPQAGLEALAPPDPANIPNNHLSYAVQWFGFAITALLIYALALRRRWRSASPA